VNFKVGDLVLAHLRKDKFPKKEYNKVKWKNIGPCNIMRKFSSNSYEIELPKDVGISPIFNIADLYPYHVGEYIQTIEQDGKEKQVLWEVQLPKMEPMVPERILDTRVSKQIRGKEYFEYLV